ncbi:MAG TPA: M1 family metallopeptidase [Cytophagaceae bacterium]|nr:M1 family metallopeptidase [Cytophagaceae bacterium]
MRLNSFPTLLLVLWMFVLSCKTKQKTTSSGNTKQAVKKDDKKNQQPTNKGTYQPSKTLKNDLLHTRLEVSFDWKNQYLNGTAILIFKPYFYPQNILELDAKGMDIHSIDLISPQNQSLKYTYDKKKIFISLDKTYQRKDSFTIQIKYTAKPNELPIGGSEAITSDKGLYFINPDGKEPNKPRQIWTQGETESSSCWFPTIDSPNERTTQEMYITVDTNFVVLSNGEFIYSQKNVGGTKTEHWKQELPHAPYLFMMVVGEFEIYKDHWRDMEVNYYVEPKFAPYAKNIFGNTPEMIEFFSNKLGYKYPWAKYSEIVVRDYVSGAMENTSATIFYEALQVDDRSLLDENWDFIIAHELFHHWFGDLVTCESWSNLPLNESFANYSEYLWAENKYGIDEAELHREKELLEYFDEAKRKQEPLIRYKYLDKEDMFDRHSYNKGGCILHMLRKYVGDEAFFESLKLYLHRNKFTSVEVHDLRLAFEDVTGEDLNWFFNQWFLSPGHPELRVSHTYSNGLLRVHVDQLQDSTRSPTYRLPLGIDIWVNGIKTSQNITINKASQDFDFPMLAQPQLVYFDNDPQLVGIVYHEQSIEELLFQFNNSELYSAKRSAFDQIFSLKEKETGNTDMKFNNPVIREIFQKALTDKFWAIRELALDQFTKYFIPEIATYIKYVQNIAESDPKPPVRARAIQFLSSYSNAENIEIYKKAMNEKPYSVLGAGLSAYLKSGDKSYPVNFAEYEVMDNINITIPLAEYYTKVKDKTKYNWFENKIKTGNDRELYTLLHYFGQYVMLLDNGDKAKGKEILKDISVNNKYEVIKSLASYYLEKL